MEARFTNGSTVSRVWTDNEAELLAAFQYQTDAISFAQARLIEDAKNQFVTSYIICDTGSGKVTVIRPKAES